MCLITDQKKSFKAEEDMVVYKVLKKTDEKSFYLSVYSIFKWELGRLYKTRIRPDKDFCGFDDVDIRALNNAYGIWWSRGEDKRGNRLKCFGAGFHTAFNKKRLRPVQLSNEVLMKCTIPKGSLYYVNPSGLVVSNQLIINKKSKQK